MERCYFCNYLSHKPLGGVPCCDICTTGVHKIIEYIGITENRVQLEMIRELRSEIYALRRKLREVRERKGRTSTALEDEWYMQRRG